MKVSPEFIAGFASAVVALGREGDTRSVDWSAAYAYLEKEVQKFEPVEDPAERVASAISAFYSAHDVRPADRPRAFDNAWRELVAALREFKKC
jgi:hypothetical protein